MKEIYVLTCDYVIEADLAKEQSDKTVILKVEFRKDKTIGVNIIEPEKLYVN